MSRQIFLLDLKSEELAADYDAAHGPGGVPEAVLDDIRDAGIRLMEIWRSGTRLVLLTEADGDAAARVGSDASREWEQRMDRFQQPLPWADAGVKWQPAARIFTLPEGSAQSARSGGSLPAARQRPGTG